MKTKRCSNCKKIKPIGEFSKRKASKDGYQFKCRECRTQYRKDNKEHISQRDKQYRKDNKEYIKQYFEDNKGHKKQYDKQYRESNKEHISQYFKQWCRDNREHYRQLKKQWQKNNKQQIRQSRKEYLKNNIKAKLSNCISGGIRHSLKGGKNSNHWENIVGYTVEDLKKHLENQFRDDMNWDKFLNGEIHIDHIVPVSYFDFDSYEDDEFLICWSLKNLQPLWAKGNLEKSKKIYFKNYKQYKEINDIFMNQIKKLSKRHKALRYAWLNSKNEISNEQLSLTGVE